MLGTSKQKESDRLVNFRTIKYKKGVISFNFGFVVVLAHVVMMNKIIKHYHINYLTITLL